MSATVLVIDDDYYLKKLFTYLISKTGFNVLQAEDVATALNLLANEEVQVVLTDVQLPDGNGVELTRIIKARYPLIEVIAITSAGKIADGVRAMKNGAFDYLEKGVENDKLVALVTDAAEKAQLQFRIHQLEKEVTEVQMKNKKDIIALNLEQLEKATLILKAIHSPLRQQILNLIFTHGRASVTEIYTQLNIPQAIASQHLLLLKNANLVNTTREKRNVYYAANYTGIEKIIALVQQLLA